MYSLTITVNTKKELIDMLQTLEHESPVEAKVEPVEFPPDNDDEQVESTEPAKEPVKEAKTYTPDDIKKFVIEYKNKHGNIDAVKKLLTDKGYGKVSEIPEDKTSEFAESLKGMI